MKPCHFVRKNCQGWEYGIMDQENRKHIVIGKEDTYEAACAANNMVTEGLARKGFNAGRAFNWYESSEFTEVLKRTLACS